MSCTLVSDKNNDRYELTELKILSKCNEELLSDEIYVINYFDSHHTIDNHYLTTAHCSDETLPKLFLKIFMHIDYYSIILDSANDHDR